MWTGGHMGRDQQRPGCELIPVRAERWLSACKDVNRQKRTSPTHSSHAKPYRGITLTPPPLPRLVFGGVITTFSYGGCNLLVIPRATKTVSPIVKFGFSSRSSNYQGGNKPKPEPPNNPVKNTWDITHTYIHCPVYRLR